MRWSLWALAPFALGACAGGMDAAECRTADWRAIGYEDGAQGRGPQYIGERRKACADYGVTADFGAYMAGRGEGLAQFCHPYNGYRLGTGGYRYAGICPAELEPAFLTAHADGYGLYERSLVVNGLRHRLQRGAQRSKDIEQAFAQRTLRLVAPEVEMTERAAIAIELKQLAEEQAQIEASIGPLERDLAAAERDYRNYSNSIAARPRP